MGKILVIFAILVASTLTHAASWESILKSDTSESWSFSENEKIQITINTFKDDAAKPANKAAAAEYIKKQELVRSWINRVMGISEFTVTQFEWNAKDSRLSFSGKFKNGADVQNFKEEHVFADKIRIKQLVWPASEPLDSRKIASIWESKP